MMFDDPKDELKRLQKKLLEAEEPEIDDMDVDISCTDDELLLLAESEEELLEEDYPEYYGAEVTRPKDVPREEKKKKKKKEKRGAGLGLLVSIILEIIGIAALLKWCKLW